MNQKLNVEKIVEQIIEINHWFADFWTKSFGWLPKSAAHLINKSRLDRQVSLSNTLRLWINHKSPLSDGKLILAWSNLGSLVEGSLKLFFSIFYEDYKKDTRAYRNKAGILIDPDILHLEWLKIIFSKSAGFDSKWTTFISLVQHRRNAIHAYKNTCLGNTTEFYQNIELYMRFIMEIHNRIPYPDDIHIPNLVTI